METSTEASDKLLVEDISERVETTESYQTTSIDRKVIEEGRIVTYETTQEIVMMVDRSLDNSSYFHSVKSENKLNDDNEHELNLGEVNPIEHVIENDPSLNLGTKTESEITHIVNEKDGLGEGIESAILTENNQVSEAQGPSAQSNEYSSEYMLEHHTENVYMPEQESAALVTEQVYATELISDDSQDDNVTFVNEIEQQNLQTEEGKFPKTEAELVIEETKLNAAEEALQNQDTNEHGQEPLKTDAFNIEPSSVDKDNTEDQNDETAGNEVSGMESIEQVVGDVIDDGEEQNVKDEDALMQVDVQQPTVDKDDDRQPVVENFQEINTADQPMNDEQIVDASNESIESIELTNVATSSSENVTLQSYALPEDLEVTEVKEGEYTLVDGSGTLNITHEGEEGNSDGTLVLVQNYEQPENFEQSSEEGGVSQLSEDQQELYMTELRGQAESRQSTSSVTSESKPRRGRKPTFEIPMHVLGHDISKPVETVPNGRALPKPRLGVKVPYRNLTSQIVSKAEIEKEIMNRARIKQEQAISKGNALFARKLTQRLARKIAPSPNHPKRVVTTAKAEKASSATKESELIDPLALGTPETSVESSEQQQKINNDSDLLAILEGEGDDMPVLPKEVPQPIEEDVDVKMLEREIALQQLQELPHQEPKPRIFKGRQMKPEAKTPVLIVETSTVAKIKTADKAGTTTKTAPPSSAQTPKKAELPHTPVSCDKENASKPAKDATTTSSRREQVKIDLPLSPKKSTVDVEPQVKVNMVLKTYSRKRKTIEVPEPFPESPVPKKPMLNDSETKMEKSDPPSDVYVTKSSRVIKRKVIWDPDEIPARSPKPAKADGPVKAVKPAEKVAEKAAEKKPPSEKVVKEKPPEKKPVEKSVVKKIVNDKTASPVEKKAPKSDSSKHNKSPNKNKKSLSEVDRLLMDEGAVKMLYDLKNNEESAGRKKKDVYSVERAQKELLKKANEIKNDLQQNTSNESPKSLRKKEGGLPAGLLKPAVVAASGERKMSKDSTRSSLHTPPGSPAYSQSSMLVRRRSSSSISSSDEVSTDESAKIARKKSGGDGSKPKKVKKTGEPQVVEDAKEAPQPKLSVADTKSNQFKSFTVKKVNKHVTIDLNYDNDVCYCTAQMLEELTVALKKYAKDKDCNVVSVTSSSKAFCLGLDYASLVSDNEEIRKKNAVELSQRVRDFLLCLLNFPKVLVAGIKGDCVGLGVTMLPLFDMVIASDTATFSTPYASLGCVSEAGFLLSSPHLTNHGLAAELLFTTQKLTADDVFRRGLISRLCWPEKYNETLKTILSSFSKGSRQSLEATKKQLRQHLVQTTEAAINAESKLLVEHWTGAECQKSFAELGEAGN